MYGRVLTGMISVGVISSNFMVTSVYLSGQELSLA